MCFPARPEYRTAVRTNFVSATFKGDFMETNGKLKFGVGTPQIFGNRSVSPSEIKTYLQRAEALGFHSLWVQEPMGVRNTGALESLSFLNFAAAVTERALLGPAVLLIPLRNPVPLAQSLATLDQLSRGRLIAGVGLGAYTHVYPAYGIPVERRAARYSEALKIMKMLWTEERVSFDGEFWKISDASLSIKPFQKPHPPMWFGGGAPAALKRAVDMGSGFIGAGSCSTADFRSQVRLVREFLEKSRQDPTGFMVSKRVYLAIDRHRGRAAKRLREWFGWYYGRAEMADQVTVCGSPQECIDGLAEITQAGATLLILNPVFDMAEQLELLASDIVPKMSST
jgi:probable F420-dependent oxidoreductase